MSYQTRKAERTKRYYVNLNIRQQPCSACNGSGRYDNNGSPACGGCDGTGKETYKPVFGQKFIITTADRVECAYANGEDIVRLFPLRDKFESKFHRKYVIRNMQGEVINSLADYYMVLYYKDKKGFLNQINQRRLKNGQRILET